MDFQPKIKYILPVGTPLPYFMLNQMEDDRMGYAGLAGGQTDFLRENGSFKGATDPFRDVYGVLQNGREEEVLGLIEDFEYLQRTYPIKVNRYQKRVAEIMDTMDYEGSMIYDEFPDRLSLLDLGSAVAKVLAGMDPRQPENMEMSGMEEAYLQGLAQVLVCNEIYRRRQKKRNQGGNDDRITKGVG